jgi:hypothetical protein
LLHNTVFYIICIAPLVSSKPTEYLQEAGGVLDRWIGLSTIANNSNDCMADCSKHAFSEDNIKPW